LISLLFEEGARDTGDVDARVGESLRGNGQSREFGGEFSKENRGDWGIRD
jgi:hypothetical protein